MWYIVTFVGASILSTAVVWYSMSVEYTRSFWNRIGLSNSIELSYADTILILLTILGIVIAIVTIGISILAFYTYNRIRIEARTSAKLQAKNETENAISKLPILVSEEVGKQVRIIIELLEKSGEIETTNIKSAVENFKTGFLDEISDDNEDN